MLAAILCLIALAGTFWAGRRSLSQGLLALFTVGYFYGILRANLPTTASHFLFDASLLGFYLSQPWAAKPSESQSTAAIQSWTMILIAWPCLLSLVPFQNVLVTLVGLRGNIFFLPLMVFGARLKSSDLSSLAFGVALLNLVALSVGILEFSFGVEKFFPRSEVTSIIYASTDVAAGSFRIPSIFTSAHAYAGAMVMTIPLLFGAWMQRDKKDVRRQVILASLIAALVGVLLSATRLHFVVAAILVGIALVGSGLSVSKRVVWMAAIAIVAVVCLGTDRLQRFTTLRDTKMIDTRINGSVNSGFWDILHDYPLGNGLGGGGTSMPYFLQNQVHNPIAMENEYARILAEQGVVGLLLWIAFIVWYLCIGTAFQKNRWRHARLLAWSAGVLYFATGLIGTGLLTAIPQTAMLLLFLGWVSTRKVPQRNESPFAKSSIVPLRREITSTFSV